MFVLHGFHMVNIFTITLYILWAGKQNEISTHENYLVNSFSRAETNTNSREYFGWYSLRNFARYIILWGISAYKIS